jgi:hypothetical protein
VTFVSPSETESELSPSHAALPCPSWRLHPKMPSDPKRSGSSSSPGVFQRFPSIETLTARPLPDGCPSFGTRMPTSCSFRPCRSSRLRRFAPRAPRRFVAPCTRSWGSVRFGLHRPATSRQHERSQPSPRPRFTPFRAFPSTTAVPRHRGPCPHTVRALLERSSPIPRLFSVAESVAAPGVAADHSPLLSWASFPSRVLPEFSFSVKRRGIRRSHVDARYGLP